ncbi:cation:proton antiporter regulatory subunit [Desertibacillus haloalkaliphilus]|uniref:cation:proton antiporter regulatory subunit n=1 Tax=Desertibacillus haloalkaliphilus TaxID=1328930 RepID=UPI001C27B217|nr:cation:proton antiporter regulatory subunit [Desertibacillus haloalkaliphilus]MBU8904999.1 cation:proton antiporter regulatory subunit [Desertibacillus haloalkaliphilus]
MNVKMADLPGIGKKMSFLTAEGSMIVLIIHHTGKREMYFFKDADDDEADFSMDLSADETRELGAQLLGAVFQPVDSDKMKLFKSQIVMEWICLKKRSPLTNKSIGDSEIGKRTGVSIVGIFRDQEVIASPGVDEILQSGDTLMAIGKSEQIADFEKLCEGEATD